MESFYATDRLADAMDAMYHHLDDMKLLRRYVDRFANHDAKKARECLDALGQQRASLAESLEQCRLSLLELELEQLAQAAGKLKKALLGFNLLTPDYTQMTTVFEGFLAQLPSLEDEAALADLHGRLRNNLRIGYFPTDAAHVALIRQGIAFPETISANLFDPCCGEGRALQQLAIGRSCTTYGVEIDSARADQAVKLLDRVGYGSYFFSEVSRRAFHLLFLNPPYLSVLNGSGGSARHEKRFLLETLEQLVMGGLLVYIIPYYRFTEDMARILCDNYGEISVYRFLSPEFERFRQVAFFGVRKQRENGSREAAVLLERIREVGQIPLLDTLPENRYRLPDTEASVSKFQGEKFNVQELTLQLQNSPSISRRIESKHSTDAAAMRPLLPLSIGQVGILGGSGYLNGLTGNRHPHIVKGRIIKNKITNETETEDGKKSGTRRTVQTVTHVNQLVFSILTQDGFRSLS